MKLNSYWLDTGPSFRGSAAEPVEGRADVVVVGGGFTGLSASLTLARRGVAVTLLEAGKVASEASGRNGGHCNNGLAVSFSTVAARYGHDRAREMYQAFDRGVDLVERLVAEEKIDCGFVRCGKIKLAAKPAHYDSLAKNCELLARDVDPDVALLSQRDLSVEVGSPIFHGGLLQRRSAAMHMGRFGVGLAEAAVRAGARIHEQAPVTAIERIGGGRFRVASERGAIEAGGVLVATGVSARGPFGWFRRRIVPIGSFIVVTAPLTRAVQDSIMPGRRVCTTSLNIGNYFRLTDDRLVFGGRARFAMSSPRSDQKSGRILQKDLAAAFPQLGPVPIDYCWGGLVDLTQDRLPHAGEHDGIHYAMGYSGHGTQMSVLMGRIMAEIMTGGDTVNPWRDREWPAIPGHFGPPWFLPFVGAYYRLKDRLH